MHTPSGGGWHNDLARTNVRTPRGTTTRDFPEELAEIKKNF